MHGCRVRFEGCKYDPSEEPFEAAHIKPRPIKPWQLAPPGTSATDKRKKMGKDALHGAFAARGLATPNSRLRALRTALRHHFSGKKQQVFSLRGAGREEDMPLRKELYAKKVCCSPVVLARLRVVVSL